MHITPYLLPLVKLAALTLSVRNHSFDLINKNENPASQTTPRLSTTIPARQIKLLPNAEYTWIRSRQLSIF